MPAAYRVRKHDLYVSAKITIRETDGTEYQLKKRVAQSVLAAGYCRKEQRGLFVMLSVSLTHALKVITHDWDSGVLKAPGPPSSLNLGYPVRDMKSNPRPFGYAQNWARFPVNV